MNSDRWDRIEALFHQVKDLAKEEQRSVLERECAGDEALLKEVLELLGDSADSFLENPEHLQATELAPGSSDGGGIVDVQGFESTSPTDRYRELGQLGAGGMGEVLEVWDEQLRRPLAMKVMRSAERTDQVERFCNEARITGQLSHPGVIPVHEMGRDASGRYFFTMQKVEGTDLDDLVPLIQNDAEDWNVPRVLRVMVQVCQAMAFAHENRVVHRDLKPANIMTGRFGEVYVVDWGLAKNLDGEAPLPASPTDETGSAGPQTPAAQTVDGTIMGTPSYMSPEQARGDVRNIDALSDIYSLGAILYRLLTGVVPYSDTVEPPSSIAILKAIGSGPPTPVDLVSRKVAPELVAICHKAMARERVDRYQSAAAIADDLQAYLDVRVVSAYESGAFARLKKWARRQRTAIGVTVGVAVLLIAGAYWAGFEGDRREADRLVRRGEASYRQFLEARARERELRFDLSQGVVDSFLPIWLRDKETEVYDGRIDAQQLADESFSNAIIDFSSAIEMAPTKELVEQATSLLSRSYEERQRETLGGAQVALSTDHFAKLVAATQASLSSAGTETASALARFEVAVRSEPAGVEIYCFRYAPHDARVLPVPFDVEAGSVGAPFLRVEFVDEAFPNPLQKGDVLREVNRVTIRTRRDLARSLEGLGVGEKVSATIDRTGESTTVDWIPFSPELAKRQQSWEALSSKYEAWGPGRLVLPEHQLGLRFEGYPLTFAKPMAAGETPRDLSLPTGSYLLVLRKDGFEDLRVPVAVPSAAALPTFRLLPNGSTPEGYLRVAEGPAELGGDAGADQSLVRRVYRLPSFFFSRTEVTAMEYLKFVNDPAILARTETDPEKDEYRYLRNPESEAVRVELQRKTDIAVNRRLSTGVEHRSVQIIPESWRFTRGMWLPRKERDLLRPVFDVPWLACVEYAHWKSRGDPDWNYRLPSDVEWEKAARGVDLRIYVWGQRFVPAFCNSSGGSLRRGRVDVGTTPYDESVYGVRDLMGSVEEFTSGRPRRGARFVSRRGGSWDCENDYYFRAANRNGLFPEYGNGDIGFRLVAERVEDPDKTE